jgi:hypothetical protein
VNPSSVLEKIKKKMEKAFFPKVFLWSGQKNLVQRAGKASPRNNATTILSAA